MKLPSIHRESLLKTTFNSIDASLQIATFPVNGGGFNSVAQFKFIFRGQLCVLPGSPWPGWEWRWIPTELGPARLVSCSVLFGLGSRLLEDVCDTITWSVVPLSHCGYYENHTLKISMCPAYTLDFIHNWYVKPLTGNISSVQNSSCIRLTNALRLFLFNPLLQPHSQSDFCSQSLGAPLRPARELSHCWGTGENTSMCAGVFLFQACFHTTFLLPLHISSNPCPPPPGDLSPSGKPQW